MGAATVSGDRQESDVGDVSRAASEGDFALRGGEPKFQSGLLRYGRVRTRLTSVTTLSKIAQGTQTANPNSVAASQNASVKGA
ncbi:hypothetical protein Dimus_003799 [Dionaea muscipula]